MFMQLLMRNHRTQLREAIRCKEPCFLNSQQWYHLLVEGPSSSFLSPLSTGLTLRLHLHSFMVELPSLILDYSAMKKSGISQDGWAERLDRLIRQVAANFDDVKRWLVVEAEPLFTAQPSDLDFFGQQVYYPDMTCGVVDAVANTYLLILDKMFQFLCELRPRLDIQAGIDNRQWLQRTQLLSISEDIERRGRVVTAFNYVKGECEVAAKPLLFGLQIMQSSTSNCFIEVA